MRRSRQLRGEGPHPVIVIEDEEDEEDQPLHEDLLGSGMQGRRITFIEEPDVIERGVFDEDNDEGEDDDPSYRPYWGIGLG